MFKKLNTAKLLGILVLLVLVYLGFNYFDNTSRSKEFRQELVVIDTANVNRIYIQKGDEELELKKEDGTWQVKIANGQFKNATPSSVKRTLENIMTIKPSRVVARSKEKWKDYQVDTLGTRVKVAEGDKNTLDLVIGRLQFVDQRKYYTYVRLFEEEDVYVADNFLAMSISPSPNNFRDGKVLEVKKDSIQQVNFNYTDAAFSLSKMGNEWAVNGMVTDSASTIQFLNSLGRLSSNNFYDENLPETNPDYRVEVIENNGSVSILKGWTDEDNEVIIKSSVNSDNVFKDKNLADKLFKEESYFFPNE